jgi:hypothetical protein
MQVSLRRTIGQMAALVLGVVFLLGVPSLGFASPSYAGKIRGTFSDQVLAGNILDLTGNPVFFDNTATAFTFADYNETTNLALLNWGTPGVSILGFLGAEFSNVAPDEEFDLGVVVFLNSTSNLDSLIFGATLTLEVLDSNGMVIPTITPVVSLVDIVTTSNGLISQVLDADFIGFSEFSTTFHVYEFQAATAILRGKIVGDPMLQLTDIQLFPGQQPGFLGQGPVVIPEPTTLLLLSTGLVGLLGYARRKRLV